MARLALAALCFAAFAATSHGITITESDMNKACTAHEAVCWYENLKQFPNTNSTLFGSCAFACNTIKGRVLAMKEEQYQFFGHYFAPSAWLDGSMPSEYQSNCESVLESNSPDTSDDESDAMNDQHQKYPLRAFAYCMMKTLRSRHGDKAIEAVKSEKTHGKKDWKQSILDRDNEFRALHGSEPLTPNSELDEAAQQWAEKNAADCEMHHTEEAQREWNGKKTGENLNMGGGDDVSENAAYWTSAIWYEEGLKYPFPEGVKGTSDPRIHGVGHFTQTVWKDSKLVGYGYAYSPKCEKFFIAARYYPGGNVDGGFQKNVLPPK